MRDIRRILCPVDFSESSKHALDHAVVIARWYGASIVGLHVATPVSVPTPVANGYQFESVAERAEFERLGLDLAAFIEAAGTEGLDVSTRVVHGAPARAIVQCAAAEDVDLIAIGTHGAGGFEHLVLGSVAEKVLRKAACPVLTVPPRARATSRLPFKKILCPVDFSPPSIEALQFALSLAEEGDAALTVLHVVEWPADDDPVLAPFGVAEYRRDCERDATTRLEALVPDAAREWCRPATRIGHGKPYREIAGVATEDAADLIVMGVHGRNVVDLLLFGSTTNHVVRQASCPVLTVRT